MGHPPSLRRLLTGANEIEREAAWEGFVEEHSRLIVHTARRTSSDHDDVMDRYAFVLDRLRQDDFRRLRAFSLNGTGKFTTWLVVVVRRLCVDHHRARYGRARDTAPDSADSAARTRLMGALSGEVDPDDIPDDSAPGPHDALVRTERAETLSEALEELPPKDQLLLTLRHLDDRSTAEIARMLGYSSRFAVHRRLKKLTSALRRRLEDKGIER